MSTITLPKRIKDTDQLIAIPRKEYDDLVALKQTLRDSVDLRRDIDAWDELSDEALRNMRDRRGHKIRL